MPEDFDLTENLKTDFDHVTESFNLVTCPVLFISLMEEWMTLKVVLSTVST